MEKVFDRSASGPEATRQLLNICQGARSVSEYSIEFRTLAATADWTQAVLIEAFQKGLDDRIVDRLVTRETPMSLEALIDLAIRIDSRLTVREEQAPLQCFPYQATARYQPSPQPYASFSTPQTPEAVACARTHASWPSSSNTTGTHQTHQGAALPLLWQKNWSGHRISNCLVKDNAHQ